MLLGMIKPHHIDLFVMLKITNNVTHSVDIIGVDSIPEE